MGPHYDVLRTWLSWVRDATHPTRVEQLQAEALALVAPLLSWASHFGWTVEPNSSIGPVSTDWDFGPRVQ